MWRIYSNPDPHGGIEDCKTNTWQLIIKINNPTIIVYNNVFVILFQNAVIHVFDFEPKFENFKFSSNVQRISAKVTIDKDIAGLCV
jgi:hypothetical protein